MDNDIKTTHPVLAMSHGRAKVWKEQATDEDFMKYISDLASIYSGIKREQDYRNTGTYKPLDDMILFKDFKKWLDKNGQI